MKILQNIHRSAVTFNTNVYPLFFDLKIFYKYLRKGWKKIHYIIFKDLQINIDGKNSLTLFYDILYCTDITNKYKSLLMHAMHVQLQNLYNITK